MDLRTFNRLRSTRRRTTCGTTGIAFPNAWSRTATSSAFSRLTVLCGSHLQQAEQPGERHPSHHGHGRLGVLCRQCHRKGDPDELTQSTVSESVRNNSACGVHTNTSPTCFHGMCGLDDTRSSKERVFHFKEFRCRSGCPGSTLTWPCASTTWSPVLAGMNTAGSRSTPDCQRNPATQSSGPHYRQPTQPTVRECGPSGHAQQPSGPLQRTCGAGQGNGRNGRRPLNGTIHDPVRHDGGPPRQPDRPRQRDNLQDRSTRHQSRCED